MTETGSGNQKPEELTSHPRDAADSPPPSGERSVGVEGDVTESVIVTGDRNVVTVFKSVAPWAVRVIVIGVIGILLFQVPTFLRENIHPLLVPPPRVEIVLDVSHRMTAEFDEPGNTKFNVARDAIFELLDTLEGREVEASLRLMGGSGGTETCEVFSNLSLLVDFTQDYERIRQELRALRPYGPEAPEAPLVDTLKSSLQHLTEEASPSQTLMIYTGGDDTCGESVQYFFDTLVPGVLTGETIRSKTFLIVLSSETVDFTGALGHDVSLTLAQTAQEVKDITSSASESLPPTPTPQAIARLVDSIANLAPGTPTATPSLTVTTQTSSASATTIASVDQVTLATPTPISPTPSPIIAEAMPTSTPVPRPVTPTAPLPDVTNTPRLPPTPTTVYSSTPSPTYPVATTLAAETPTAIPTVTPTSTRPPTSTATNIPTLTPTPTNTQVPTPTPTDTPTPMPEVGYDPGSRTITIAPGNATARTGRLCKGKIADVSRNAVFMRSADLQAFGEPAGLLATVTHDYPEKSINITLENVELGQYNDDEVNADGEALNYGNCAFNAVQGMREQLKLPLELGDFDDLARYDHGTITIQLSSTPVEWGAKDKPVKPGVFAASDQANMASQAITFRQFYVATAAVNSTVSRPGSEDDTSYRIAYDRVSPEHWAGWEIVLPEIDVSGYSRLAFDIKGHSGGEIPNVWLASPPPPDETYDARNYVEIEDYVTVNKDWQRIEIPLGDFQPSPDGPEHPVDLTHIKGVQILFEWEDMAGMVYVDGFAFE
jgi:hypothetical protein